MPRQNREDALLRSVGRRIAELRRELGRTQEQLAGQLDCSVKYVQSIEGGGENLTLRSLARIATELGVDVKALLAPPASPPPTRRSRKKR